MHIPENNDVLSSQILLNAINNPPNLDFSETRPALLDSRPALLDFRPALLDFVVFCLPILEVTHLDHMSVFSSKRPICASSS